MNLDGVDCKTRSPDASPDRGENNFDSPLKNERIMRLSESGSTKVQTFGINRKSNNGDITNESFGNVERAQSKSKSPFKVS